MRKERAKWKFTNSYSIWLLGDGRPWCSSGSDFLSSAHSQPSKALSYSLRLQSTIADGTSCVAIAASSYDHIHAIVFVRHAQRRTPYGLYHGHEDRIHEGVSPQGVALAQARSYWGTCILRCSLLRPIAAVSQSLKQLPIWSMPSMRWKTPRLSTCQTRRMLQLST